MRYLLTTIGLYIAVVIVMSMKYSLAFSADHAWLEMLCCAVPVAFVKFLHDNIFNV